MSYTVLKYPFGTIELHGQYVIAVMKEGVTVIPEYNDVLVKIAETFFHERPFAYITNRKNSYSVDPQVYRKTSLIDNLVAFAVVTNKEAQDKTLELEKIFLDKPFEPFRKLDDAIDWVEDILANTPQESFKK